MKILDGKTLANQLQKKIKKQVEAFVTRNKKPPKLAIILERDSPASQIYVNSKHNVATKLGISAELNVITQAQKILLDLIEKLNQDKNTHAILVQLPLSKKNNKTEVINKISVTKDVDCFNHKNMGKLFVGDHVLSPCTPEGIITLLEHYEIPISGKHAVVVGRSNLVGKPISKLLLDKNATVTTCHSKTNDLESYTRQGDIVVVAAGKKRFLGASAFKKTATVIDVGIHRDKGNICGDVKFEELDVYAATPVPGGVGPMTVTMLMQNTLYLASKIEDGV